MSTPSRSASSCTPRTGFTLKPIDDGVGDDGQVDVVLGDATDAAVHDPQVDLVADVELDQRVLQRLDGAGVVTLDDQRQLFDLLLGQRVTQSPPG